MNLKGEVSMGNYIDINTFDFTKCSDEKFILDTNALLWAFYPNSQSSCLQAACYSNFIAQLITANKKIYIPMFNFCEAINVIEKIEHKIYKKNSRNNIKLKDYRAIPLERQKLKNVLELFVEQIENISNIIILEQNLELNLPKTFINDFSKHRLDLFDIFLIDISNKSNFSIITDDKDFLSVNCNSNIYTCNQTILSNFNMQTIESMSEAERIAKDSAVEGYTDMKTLIEELEK